MQLELESDRGNEREARSCSDRVLRPSSRFRVDRADASFSDNCWQIFPIMLKYFHSSRSTFEWEEFQALLRQPLRDVKCSLNTAQMKIELARVRRYR